jgi:hypothetical protein
MRISSLKGIAMSLILLSGCYVRKVGFDAVVVNSAIDGDVSLGNLVSDVLFVKSATDGDVSLES